MNRKKQLYRFLKKWINEVLINQIFPPTCPVCQCILRQGEQVCPECAKQLIPVQEPFCKKCGQPVDAEEMEYCFDCSRKIHEYDSGRALWLYQGAMKTSLYRFKYSNKREYANYYGEYAANHAGKWIRKLNIEAIIPVPLHSLRRKKRGYNQAELFAKVLGEHLDIPVRTDCIRRVVNTRPQKELDDTARKNNLKRAFKICQDKVQLKSILIVDDIYTTGSTIDSVAREFREAGVDHIYFLCISIGRGL